MCRTRDGNPDADISHWHTGQQEEFPGESDGFVFPLFFGRNEALKKNYWLFQWAAQTQQPSVGWKKKSVIFEPIRPQPEPPTDQLRSSK